MRVIWSENIWGEMAYERVGRNGVGGYSVGCSEETVREMCKRGEDGLEGDAVMAFDIGVFLCGLEDKKVGREVMEGFSSLSLPEKKWRSSEAWAVGLALAQS